MIAENWQTLMQLFCTMLIWIVTAHQSRIYFSPMHLRTSIRNNANGDLHLILIFSIREFFIYFLFYFRLVSCCILEWICANIQHQHIFINQTNLLNFWMWSIEEEEKEVVCDAIPMVKRSFSYILLWMYECITL